MHDPVAATYLGDHRGDGRLGDPSAAGAAARAAQLRDAARRTRRAGPRTARRRGRRGGAAYRAGGRTARPRGASARPSGTRCCTTRAAALHSLLTRDYAPLAAATASPRATGSPPYPATWPRPAAGSRSMSAIHVETALAQLEGTIALIDTELPAARAATDVGAGPVRGRRRRPGRAGRALPVAARATAARRAGPQLGAGPVRARSWHSPSTRPSSPSTCWQRRGRAGRGAASSSIELAGRFAGRSAPDTTTVRAVLDELATDVADDTHDPRALPRRRWHATREFVRERELVTVYDDPVDGRGDAGDRPRRRGRVLPARTARWSRRRCRPSTPCRRPRRTGTPSRSRRSTASTTCTCCRT